jgi:hypothetical protein
MKARLIKPRISSAFSAGDTVVCINSSGTSRLILKGNYVINQVFLKEFRINIKGIEGQKWRMNRFKKIN